MFRMALREETEGSRKKCVCVRVRVREREREAWQTPGILGTNLFNNNYFPTSFSCLFLIINRMESSAWPMTIG